MVVKLKIRIPSGLFFLLSLFSIVAIAQPKMVFESGGQVYLANPDGTQGRQLTQGPLLHRFPDIDASGTNVVYGEGLAADKLTIVIENVTSGLKKKWDAVGAITHPRFSGNGRFLTFSAAKEPEGVPQIFVVDLSRSEKENVPVLCEIIATQGSAFSPSLSSDGGKVLLERQSAPGKSEVVIYDLATKISTVLSDAGAAAPSFSFDDNWAVFTQRVGGQSQVFLYDLVNAIAIQVTYGPGNKSAPTFLATGAIAFAAEDGARRKMFVIDSQNVETQEFKATPLLNNETIELNAVRFSGEINFAQINLGTKLFPGRQAFGLATQLNHIYLVGGRTKGTLETALDVFDVEKSEWHRKSPRPIASADFALIASQKFLYAFGGGEGPNADQIDRYDTEKDEWKTIGKLPQARAAYAVAEAKGKIYLLGGIDRTTGMLLPGIAVFDPQTELMSQSSYTLPAPLRRDFTAVASGNEIFLVGGRSTGLLNNVTGFNPENGRHRELSPLPNPLARPAIGAIGRTLYLFSDSHVLALALLSACSPWTHTGRYLLGKGGADNQVRAFGDGDLAIVGEAAFEIFRKAK